ncbi:MAG: hypothetical protein JOZ32_20330 [Bryobacterales bacterium]|nr:hypothetical protein [Bryobacterales bacterium]
MSSSNSCLHRSRIVHLPGPPKVRHSRANADMHYTACRERPNCGL